MSRLDPDIVKARDAAYRAARVVSAGNADLAASVLLGAELSVIRRLVAGALPTGEVGYWQIVEKELGR